MKTLAGLVAPLFLALALTACATSEHPSRGLRVLDAVVAERSFEPFARNSGDAMELGNWYLVFETRDGEANARYRLPVTQFQYMRFPEGTSVQLTLVDYSVRDIRHRS